MRWKTLHGVLSQGCYHPTRWTSGDVRKWLQTWGVFPHWALVSNCPLIHRSHRGTLTSSATWRRPPYPQLNMLTGRNQRGENHVLKIPHRACCVRSVQLLFFFYGRGIRNTPSLRKLLQLTIMLITIAQNKSQAEKSLDGNCYNCPNNGNEYFSLLNYMWLNI